MSILHRYGNHSLFEGVDTFCSQIGYEHIFARLIGGGQVCGSSDVLGCSPGCLDTYQVQSAASLGDARRTMPMPTLVQSYKSAGTHAIYRYSDSIAHPSNLSPLDRRLSRSPLIGTTTARDGVVATSEVV